MQYSWYHVEVKTDPTKMTPEQWQKEQLEDHISEICKVL